METLILQILRIKISKKIGKFPKIILMPVILLFHRNYISNENQKLWIAKYPALCSFKLEFIEVVVVQAIM